MENKNIKEKLLNDKELLRRSVKENSSFSTADLLNIVADLIDYTLNNNLDNKTSLDDNCNQIDINIIKKLMRLEEDKKNSRTEKDFESEFNNYRRRYQLSQLQDLINKYKQEKESMIDSLDNLLSNVICDFENLK
jgi:hypothetical protein